MQRAATPYPSLTLTGDADRTALSQAMRSFSLGLTC